MRVDPVIETSNELRSRDIKYLDLIRAAVPYEKSPLVKKGIHTFKYKRIPGLCDELAQLISGVVPNDVSATLCPVPLHWSRRFQRGFNQSELLADKLESITNLKKENLLKRTRATGHQAWRDRTDRLISVKGAFGLAKGKSIPDRVILIDDLATTGATLDACAKALKEAGAKHVEAWVVAHG